MTELAQLCDRVHSGDLDAEAQLYQLLQSRILRMLIGRCPGHAEDLLQETWIRVAQAIRSNALQNAECLIGYAVIVARRLVSDHYRRARKPTAKVVSISEAVRVPDPNPDVLDDLLKRETLQGVMNGLAQLSDTDRELILMFYFEDQPADEIALALGMNPDQLRLRRWRAMKKLRVLMGIKHEAA